MQPENPQAPEVAAPVTAPIAEPVAVAPTPIAPTPMATVKKVPRQRHFLASFFISYFWGVFGADRMYMGYWGLGILKLITAGGAGIWIIVDLYLIMAGYMRDKQGREMLQIAEYKKFAKNTILFSALGVAVLILVSGVSLIFALPQIIDLTQGKGIPGLESITGGGGAGYPEDLQQELNQSN